MNYQKYRQVIAIKNEQGKRIEKICPNINNESGIYMFYRYEVSTYCYIGQSVKIKDRCVSHLMEYDHIANSLKSRGLYSEDNKGGWQLRFFNCPVSELDTKERETIQTALDKGYVLYNVTSGGQNVGKTDINERKPSKGYKDGVKHGYSQCKKEMITFFTKYLDFSIKGKPNKIKERKLDEFKKLLQDTNV